MVVSSLGVMVLEPDNYVQNDGIEGSGSGYGPGRFGEDEDDERGSGDYSSGDRGGIDEGKISWFRHWTHVMQLAPFRWCRQESASQRESATDRPNAKAPPRRCRWALRFLDAGIFNRVTGVFDTMLLDLRCIICERMKPNWLVCEILRAVVWTCRKNGVIWM